MTLEDILQQEPREKLELFPKLGYYFIVFRAIESRKSRSEQLVLNPNGAIGLVDGGFAAEVNVYLVIFREGIVSVSRGTGLSSFPTNFVISSISKIWLVCGYMIQWFTTFGSLTGWDRTYRPCPQ